MKPHEIACNVPDIRQCRPRIRRKRSRGNRLLASLSGEPQRTLCAGKWLFFDTNGQRRELHHRKSVAVKQNFIISVKSFTLRNVGTLFRWRTY